MKATKKTKGQAKNHTVLNHTISKGENNHKKGLQIMKSQSPLRSLLGGLKRAAACALIPITPRNNSGLGLSAPTSSNWLNGSQSGNLTQQVNVGGVGIVEDNNALVSTYKTQQHRSRQGSKKQCTRHSSMSVTFWQYRCKARDLTGSGIGGMGNCCKGKPCRTIGFRHRRKRICRAPPMAVSRKSRIARQLAIESALTGRRCKDLARERTLRDRSEAAEVNKRTYETFSEDNKNDRIPALPPLGCRSELRDKRLCVQTVESVWRENINRYLDDPPVIVHARDTQSTLEGTIPDPIVTADCAPGRTERMTGAVEDFQKEGQTGTISYTAQLMPSVSESPPGDIPSVHPDGTTASAPLEPIASTSVDLTVGGTAALDERTLPTPCPPSGSNKPTSMVKPSEALREHQDTDSTPSPPSHSKNATITGNRSTIAGPNPSPSPTSTIPHAANQPVTPRSWITKLIANAQRHELQKQVTLPTNSIGRIGMS